jgi:hypothetical protein
VNKCCWVTFKFTLVLTSLLLGKLEVDAIPANKATDQTEFLYFILCPMYAKTHYWIRFWKVQNTRIRFWKVQSIFISHNHHVKKEYDSHLPKPDLATLDGMTTTINIFFFLSILYLLCKLPTLLCATYPCCKRVNMATMAPPPPSTKSWQNMTNSRDITTKKISADSWGQHALF